ncbi:Conjugative accessory protein mbeC [Klebsiella pneumoniae]|uniref:MobC family plasmid mobilization relaxosome protein n=1 Tax=Klebsiella pneumoniae TaxID=573 RepID=UPI000DE6F15A|nr:MobC family plasmid mobilization relaxosome protein [Klebsiella pneumoniae]SSO21745.1 Conjugative accessory protein mbeC [Klebsiella pneumoniae]
MAGQPLKRLRSIKIRVSDAELERLRELCPKAQLAEWMREQWVGVAQPQRRTPAPTVDPALLRQLAGMGNNLNQIARRVNSGEWGPLDRLRIIAELSAIGRELEELHHDHQIP